MSEVAKETVCHEGGDDSEQEHDHDPHYEPIISLPEVEVRTLEEDESVMLSLRAKIYRYDSNETPPEWKERGTGNVKILHHKGTDKVRVVMRRDKTLKLCANHFITPLMCLKPSASCERAWVYSVKDFSDATVKSELIALKFANIDNAQKWKEVFEQAKKIAANTENSNDTSINEKNVCGESFNLNDSCEPEKRNSLSVKKEENEESSPKKQSNEVAEKLSSMTIKETEATS